MKVFVLTKSTNLSINKKHSLIFCFTSSARIIPLILKQNLIHDQIKSIGNILLRNRNQGTVFGVSGLNYLFGTSLPVLSLVALLLVFLELV